MSADITIHQAAEKAHQVELINLLIESHPHQLQDSEISTLASLMAKLAIAELAHCGKYDHFKRGPTFYCTKMVEPKIKALLIGDECHCNSGFSCVIHKLGLQ